MSNCDKCKVKGICCTIIVSLKQGGLNFYSKSPAFICEKLDVDTGLCKDYENRPEECIKFDCGGNEKPMTLNIEGVSKNGLKSE